MRDFKFIPLTALVLLGSVSIAAAQTLSRVRGGFEVEVEHVFVIESGTSMLEIDRYAGDVELTWGTNRQVVVTEVVHVDARNEEDAREQGMRAFSEIEEASDGLRIRGRKDYGDYKSIRIKLASEMLAYVNTSNGDISVFSADSDIEVSSGAGDITVTRSGADVEVKSGSGDILVSGVAGNVFGSSGAGDITLSDIGDQVELVTGAGDILVSRVDGWVNAKTGGGDVSVEDIIGDIDLTTAGGDVEAYGVEGSAELSTAGGSIEVAEIGGNLYAATLGGDVEGTSVQGTITAETMAGDIDFEDVVDEIIVSTEVGDVTIEISESSFLVDGSVKLRTDFGDVKLILPDDTNANVSIDLGFDGEFDPSDSPRSLRLREMTQDMRRGRVRSVKGVINGGGGRIEIQTGSGDVSIEGSD